MSAPSDPRQQADPTAPRQSSTQEIPVAAPSSVTPPSTAPQPAAPSGAPQPTGPVDFVPGLPGTGSPGPAAPAAGPSLPPPPGVAPPVPVAPQPVPSEPVPVLTADTGAVTGTGAGTGTRADAATGTDAPPAAPTWPDSLEDDPSGPRTSAHPPTEDLGPKRKKRRSADGAPSARRPRDPRALLGLGLVTLALVLLEVGLLVEFGARSYWSAVTLWSAFATACALLTLLAFAAFYPAGNRLRPEPAWRVAAGGLVGVAAFWLLVVLPEVASDRGFVLTAALAALGGALWIGPRRKD